MIGDIIHKDRITDISPFQVKTMRPIERINNNITVGVQIAAHNNNVTEVNNINLEIKTIQDKMTNRATIIEEITGVDPLAEACNLLGELLVTTKVDIELEKVRKRLSHILDILNKTQEIADARHVQMTCHALQDSAGPLP